MSSFHLAQANIAVSRFPLDAAEMEGFTSRIEEINAIADTLPGFVWRIPDDDAEERAQAVFGLERMVYNLTLWDSAESLGSFVYRSDHMDVMRQRASWFEPSERSPFVLWWVPAGHLPTIEESRDRFEMLWKQGPSPDAFTFRQRFESPGA